MGRSVESPDKPTRLVKRLLTLWALFPVLAFAGPADFPKPAALVPQVEFWKKVFAEWSERQVVVHDNLYLNKIYGVIDLREIDDDNERWHERHRREKAELIAVDRALANLAKGGYSAEDLQGREREIWTLFKDIDDPRKFTKARERVRTQQGLKERFRRGLEISRRYLPMMEETFREVGLPTELTRLPFVESSFNINAYSKVGAAGIWQFIPSSARIYLQFNEIEDSRRDPLYATIGAARHLRDDYEALGKWPLAVTAYNHGRAGIAKAVEKLGSDDIVDIIKHYNGKSFGFASRNFYTEFLAAVEVERDYKKFFGEVDFERKMEFHEVQIDDYLRFSTIAGLAHCSVDDLHDLNPGFTNAVVDDKLYVPKNYTVRIPAASYQKFDAAYASLPADERFSRQRAYFVVHKVTRGQTIDGIAKRYRTTVSAIQVANGLRQKRIRTGQTLKIPTG